MSERDWLIVGNRGPTFLYLIEVLTYDARHPIKIGVSKDIRKRMKHLHKMGIATPHLYGYFQFDDRVEAMQVETATRKAFPRCTRYGLKSREVLAAPLNELVPFIERASGKQLTVVPPTWRWER